MFVTDWPRGRPHHGPEDAWRGRRWRRWRRWWCVAFSYCYDHCGCERHLNASHVGVNTPRLSCNTNPNWPADRWRLRPWHILSPLLLHPPPPSSTPGDPNVLNIHVSDRGDKSSWFIWSSSLVHTPLPFPKGFRLHGRREQLQACTTTPTSTQPCTTHITHTVTHTRNICNTCTHCNWKLNERR